MNIRYHTGPELKISSHKVNNYTHEGICGSAYTDSFRKSCHISGVFCVSNDVAAFSFVILSQYFHKYMIYYKMLYNKQKNQTEKKWAEEENAMKVLSVKIVFAPLRAVFTTFISLITAGWAEDS